jgi:cytochrome c oxidase cbb3-type subunit 2
MIFKHHQLIERNSLLMLLGILVVVSIGGMVQIAPLFRVEQTIEKVDGVRPYTPLELAGRGVYIREGCYTCHSQMVRPLRDEIERYGHYSLAAESMYDHPFLWGSKRIGPDLARVGGKYSDEWHTAHMNNPRDVVPESIMPTYSFMMNHGANIGKIGELMKAYKTVGVPYTDEMIENAYNDAMVQAHSDGDASGLTARYGKKVNSRDFDGQKNFVSEMDALVAYLQTLGTLADIKDYQLQQEQKP